MVTTLIIGNGIGMALDEKYFRLESGLNYAWETFDAKEKNIISLGENKVPMTEAELERHHIIMSACNELSLNMNININWLSQEGQSFPNLYQNFIYKVAHYFFTYSKRLPENFIQSLCKFITSVDRCHIATLNYDKLIYEALVDERILFGYDGKLVDGIHDAGFSYENLFRLYDHNFGWYLHLHGSPIYYTNNRIILKSNLNTLPFNAIADSEVHNHLVLGSTKTKPSMISNSMLLDAYFDFFIQALSESDCIFIIGYSGCDQHINSEVKKWSSTKNNYKKEAIIYIIEWDCHEDKNDERLNFWKKQLLMPNDNSTQLMLESLDNILSYSFNI